MSGVRHPEVTVRLSQVDGNAFAILGACAAALRGAEVSPAEVAAFTAEATSGDYDNLLLTCQRWVKVT